MTQRLFLDEWGDAPIPEGSILVSDETSFLRHLLGEADLVVRNRRVVQWAQRVCTARGIEFERLESPAQLLTAFMTEAQARELLSRLPVGQVSAHAKPADIANGLWPQAFWLFSRSDWQAAQWLFWLCDAKPTEPELLLLGAVCEGWGADAEADLARAYEAGTPEAAWAALKEWLGLLPSAQVWAPFPAVPLPQGLFDRLRVEWKREIVLRRDQFVSELFRNCRRDELLRLASEIAAAYFELNPEALTEHEIKLLEPNLSDSVNNALRRLVRPKDPDEMPRDLDALIEWFNSAYLPFRLWEADYGTEIDHGLTHRLGRQFAEVFLDTYAHARAGGAGLELLSWNQSAHMKARGARAVTLLIVFDGLGVWDADQLLSSLRRCSERLTLETRETILSPLPTITDPAKTALITGVPPAQAVDEKALGAQETTDRKVLVALEACDAGAVVVWSLVEPDATYHKTLERTAVLSEVRARIDSLVSRIVKIVHGVSSEKPLFVVVTTDHGRLLSSSSRGVPVPPGMQSHGRAAWGGAPRQDMPPRGFKVEGEVAFLDPVRFGLSEPCAVILSDRAFETNVGNQGTECFAHGGVYPEEVFVPWLEFRRDARMEDLVCRLDGRGVAGREGTIRLQVFNPNSVKARLIELRIVAEGREVPFSLDSSVPPMNNLSVDRVWAPWPTRRALADLKALVLVKLASGEERTFSATASLESEELYATENILEDLR